jgi:hypothetical protein
MSSKLSRSIVFELMRPIGVIGSIVGKIYDLFFGRADARLSRQRENELALEIRHDVPFLFDERGGEIVTDETLRYPRPFDFASVIVVVDDLLFRFFRGRGDLRVWVAPKREPNNWSELQTVISLIDEDEPRPLLFLTDVQRVLRPRMIRLRAAFSEDRYRDLKQRLSDLNEHQRVAIRQWETETNRRLYRDK